MDTPTPPPLGRHGCLTAWLVLMIVLNALVAVVWPVVGAGVRSTAPTAGPASTLTLFAPSLLAAVNVACAIALFKNKKWGFWGICASVLVSVPINLALGAGWQASLGGVVGVGILYALLNLGDPNVRAWPRLR